MRMPLASGVVRFTRPRIWPHAAVCPAVVVSLIFVRSTALVAPALAPPWQLTQLVDSCCRAFVVNEATTLQPANVPPPAPVALLIFLNVTDSFAAAGTSCISNRPPPTEP